MAATETVQTIVLANETRSSGPTWNHWPSSLPQISYALEDGEFICYVCANGGNGSLASTQSEDPQWRIIGAQVNDENTMCQHCLRIISSDMGEHERQNRG